MKHTNPILILAFCMFCTSCNNTPAESHRNKQLYNHLSEHELDEIRLYAEQFQFKEELDGAIVYAEKPSPFAQEAIKRAAKTNERRHLPYLALFVLRLYHEKMMWAPKNYYLTTLAKSNISFVVGDDCLEYEFARIAILPESQTGFFDIHSCYDWIKEHKSQFSGYPRISKELNRIEQLKKKLEHQRQEIAAKYRLKDLENFAMRTPVISNGFAPGAVPEEIDRIVEKLREEHRTEHLPYLLEYGLNVYLKNLTLSRLARVLPVDENSVLSELIRLTKIPKYETAHEAGWLNRQFNGRFEDTNEATGYSSYQIYIYYLENWSSIQDMPNIERLCSIQKQIEKTGMQGVGGGLVCHYGCR